MKKKVAIVVVIIGLLLLVTSGVMLFLGSNNNSGEKEENKQKEKTVFKLGDYTGVYKISDGTSIFKVAHYNDKVLIHYNAGSYLGEVESELKNNKYTSDELTIEFFQNMITVTSTIEEIKSGDYEKEDYSLDDVYAEFVGSTTLAESKYNGIFKKDNISLNIYEYREDEIRFIVNSNMMIDITMNKEDGIFKTDIFETHYEIKYADDNKSLELTVTEDGKKDTKMSGKYTLDKSFTKEDILKLAFEQ